MKGEFIMFNKFKEGFFYGIGLIFGAAVIKTLCDSLTGSNDKEDKKNWTCN